MRVLITQLVHDAAAVAASLQARGHPALTIPLVNVEGTTPLPSNWKARKDLSSPAPMARGKGES